MSSAMTPTVTPIPAGYRWRSGLPWYVGQFAHARLDALTARTGLPAERYDEDGLGPSASMGAVLPSGIVIVLTEREHMVEHYGMTGPYLEADTADVADRGAAAIFAEALAAFGLGPENVDHVPAGNSASDAAAELERRNTAGTRAPNE